MNANRLVAVFALAAAVVAVGLVVMRAGSYTVNARFIDAGQMVKGGLVEVGGRQVGKVKGIELAGNGVANLRMEITDDEWDPLRRGTTARVRTVGLSGVANRYIELVPGPSTGERIPDGGVLTTAETRPIIDLDTFFNALDPATRGRLQRIIKNGSQLFAGSERDANTAFGYLAPALAEGDRLAEELARDRVAVDRLLTSGATTAGALADRREELTAGITASATTMRAIASEREALADALDRAPELLGRADGLLGGLRSTLVAVRPALRDARPVARPLADVLRRLVPVSRAARPVLTQTTALLPGLTTALDGAPALSDVAVPAITSLTTQLVVTQPIIDGLLPYLPDLVGGLVNGFGNKQGGYYDANGNYSRISVQTLVGPGSFTGLFSPLGQVSRELFRGYRTGRDARCPGGATEPADDRSNPFIEDPSTCDPADGKDGE
jgi:phospholipid/cholesterol/gamma-HCH transport system substrate-binding protein